MVLGYPLLILAKPRTIIAKYEEEEIAKPVFDHARVPVERYPSVLHVLILAEPLVVVKRIVVHFAGGYRNGAANDLKDCIPVRTAEDHC